MIKSLTHVSHVVPVAESIKQIVLSIVRLLAGLTGVTAKSIGTPAALLRFDITSINWVVEPPRASLIINVVPNVLHCVNALGIVPVI